MKSLTSCVGLPNDCSPMHNRPMCVPKRAPVFNDVSQFFSNAKQCSTTVVYVNGVGSPIQSTNISYIPIYDGNCNLFFAEFKGFFYVYGGDLLQRMMVWARDPKDTTSVQGLLGNHFTIGYANSVWNLHETIYGTYQSSKSDIVLSRKKTYVPYTIDTTDYRLRKKGRGRSSTLSTAPAVWNEIMCSIHGDQSSGAPTGSKAPSIEPTRKRTRYVYKHPDLDEIQEHIQRYPDGCAIWRVEYSHATSKQLIKELKEMELPVMLIVDPEQRSAFAWIGAIKI